VIVCMDAPPNRGSFNSAHIFGTHVPGGGAVHGIMSGHMQRSKLQFYSIISSAHFPVSNTSTSLGPQMTKWLSLGSRCAARHPTSVVTCFFFARLLWIIGAQ
jgi:hypothetical protein